MSDTCEERRRSLGQAGEPSDFDADLTQAEPAQPGALEQIASWKGPLIVDMSRPLYSSLLLGHCLRSPQKRAQSGLFTSTLLSHLPD